MRKRAIGEFCVIGPDGEISDAALHEPILAEGDDKAAREVIRKMLAEQAWSPEKIASFFGE